MGPDHAWEKWGAQDPYYGVLSDPRFRCNKLTDDSLKEFFATGQHHIEHMLETIRKTHSDFQPKRVMDYGCGVGRLLRPLSQIADTVGVDISESMLNEAQKNCPEATLIHPERLNSLAQNFDLIHSHLVFQHIPVRTGEGVLRQLVGLLSPNGIGVIHLTFLVRRLGRLPIPVWDAMQKMRGRSKLFHGLMNLKDGRPFNQPQMQMNNYNLNRIFAILRDANCSIFHVEFTSDLFPGAVLYFKRGCEHVERTCLSWVALSAAPGRAALDAP
ncbi:class I SAM-dependent methyltransferase [Occallatibacter riparius]|uniref:Class I SAM-dependent methyltransferase n=1 Tax=Occallatibacter riparius TaxID=1002689 RepID=A0A9J7BNE1_9BACT|nr:class I SAM-dependent methyltransferase [Occallatibacter riparius]UWZ84240.1 class I SAM-dependent methyltransferase [Occallatibacter riparius]